MAKPHRLRGTRGAHHRPVCCLCQSCNSPTHSHIHISFHVAESMYIFNPWKEPQGEKRSVLPGLRERLGRGGELRAGPGKISVCSPRGNKGRWGGRRKAAWTGKQPRQKQGREEQPGLGLPVLLCLALAALMGLLTQDGPNSASDLLEPASDWREQGDR